MVRHIVFFRLKDEHKLKNMENLIDALKGLEDKIDVIKNLEVGKNFTIKPSAFDVSLIVDFENKDDLETYRVHPEHKKVVDLILEINNQSAVVDYEF